MYGAVCVVSDRDFPLAIHLRLKKKLKQTMCYV